MVQKCHEGGPLSVTSPTPIRGICGTSARLLRAKMAYVTPIQRDFPGFSDGSRSIRQPATPPELEAMHERIERRERQQCE